MAGVGRWGVKHRVPEVCSTLYVTRAGLCQTTGVLEVFNPRLSWPLYQWFASEV